MSEADTEQIITELAAIVGATHISSAPADVRAYGGLEPFVVVWPGSPLEVAKVLKTCSDHGVAAGTAGYGARSTRHWPLDDGRLRVALDTRRMTNILDLDEVALTAHCQCGIQMHHLEEALRRHQLTLGPYPVEIQHSTLGGLLAAPSPTAYSPRTGWLKDAALALTVAQPDGTLVQTRVAPRKATGPDVSRFYIGSRGGFGVITTATLRVHRQAESELVLGYLFPDLLAALEAVQTVQVAGVRPARLRVLGAHRVTEELGNLCDDDFQAAVVAVLSGPQSMVSVERRLLDRAAHQVSGKDLPGASVERWWARQSAWTDERPQRTPTVGSRIPLSRFTEALPLIPRALKGRPLQLWVEEFSLHEATVWLCCKGLPNAERQLRTALLDAGLDPFRFDVPPLMDEIRQQLDATATMVVMEGEWSDSPKS